MAAPGASLAPACRTASSQYWRFCSKRSSTALEEDVHPFFWMFQHWTGVRSGWRGLAKATGGLSRPCSLQGRLWEGPCC